jgi:hypothetical protein
LLQEVEGKSMRNEAGKRQAPPASLGESDVTAFLSHLATQRNVAAATQNQALAPPALPLQGSAKQGALVVCTANSAL